MKLAIPLSLIGILICLSFICSLFLFPVMALENSEAPLSPSAAPATEALAVPAQHSDPNWAVYDIERMFVAKEHILEQFWQHKTTVQHSMNPDEDFPGYTHNLYISANGDRMLCGGSYFYYYTDFGYIVHDVFYHTYNYNLWGGDARYNADKYAEAQNFSFMTEAEAYTCIRKTLEDLGIFVSEMYDCYYLDYETLAAESERLGANPGYVWTEADNAYFFDLRQDVGGLPITDLNHGDPDAPLWPLGNQIEVLITKDGIQSLYGGGLYNIDQTSAIPVQILSSEEALTTAEDKLNPLSADGPVIITEAELCYLPCIQGTVKGALVPVWVIESKQDKNEYGQICSYTSYTFIDAISGQEIL